MESTSTPLLLLSAALAFVACVPTVVLAWLFWHIKGAEQRLQQRFMDANRETVRIIAAMRLSEAGGHNATTAGAVLSGSGRVPVMDLDEEAFLDMMGQRPNPQYDPEGAMAS